MGQHRTSTLLIVSLVGNIVFVVVATHWSGKLMKLAGQEPANLYVFYKKKITFKKNYRVTFYSRLPPILSLELSFCGSCIRIWWSKYWPFTSRSMGRGAAGRFLRTGLRLSQLSRSHHWTWQWTLHFPGTRGVQWLGEPPVTTQGVIYNQLEPPWGVRIFKTFFNARNI